MEQRPITAGRSCVCWEVSKLTYTPATPGPRYLARAEAAHQKVHYLNLKTWIAHPQPRETFVSFKTRREASQSTHGLLDDLRGITRIRPPPRCHGLFRKRRHKDNLMCMDFLFNSRKGVEGGAVQAARGLEGWGAPPDGGNWRWQRVEHNDSVDNSNHNRHNNHSSTSHSQSS